MLRELAVIPVRVYQKLLSPLLPASCRFIPSCSEYAIEAVLQHGLVRGGLLATWRLLRCAPWTTGGYDPVPSVFTCRSLFHSHQEQYKSTIRADF